MNTLGRLLGLRTTIKFDFCRVIRYISAACPPNFFKMKYPELNTLADIHAALADIDAKAQELGASHIRNSIENVVEDLSEPEGKTNARIAIGEFRAELEELITNKEASEESQSPFSLSMLTPDEALA